MHGLNSRLEMAKVRNMNSNEDPLWNKKRKAKQKVKNRKEQNLNELWELSTGLT